MLARDGASSRGGCEPLGKVVLEKFELGRIKADQREDLRSSLIRNLAAKGLAEGTNPVSVQEEVDKFVQNGHISGSNLSRLERRVERRMRGGTPALSAREQRSAPSEFSVYSRSVGSRTPRSADAAQVRAPNNTAAGSRTPLSSRGGTPSAGPAFTQASPKWSEVANYAKVLEEKEKVENRFKIKATQEKMRCELEQQMEEKEKRKNVYVEEEKKIFERQKAELQAWQEAETHVAKEQKRVALEVRKEREIQNAVVFAIKEQERKKKMKEDDAQMQRATDELEQEKKSLLLKKNKQRDAMAQLMSDWSQDRKVRDEEKRKQDELEREKVSEYQSLLDKQEARNKQNIPPARMPVGDYSPPNKAERRKKERALEDEMMKLVRVANAKAAEAEMKKAEAKTKERHTNQEFLFMQMSERDASKQVKLDENRKQKETIQAEVAEYNQWEKQRVEQQRVKNIQHRIELEKQIERKKPPTRFQRRYAEDTMSAAEVAMNRHLLEEARTMRSTLESKVSELSTTF